MTTTIRCSSLDKLFACAPGVLLEDAIRIQPESEDYDTAGDIGSALHALAASLIDTGAFDTKAECVRRGLTEAQTDTVSQHMTSAVRVWSEYGPLFTQPRTEIALEPVVDVASGLRLSGTCDVLSPVGSASGIFIDWKTGFLDDGYRHQAFGYAYGIWDALGRPETGCEVVGIVAFLRHNYCRVVKYSPQSLMDWERGLQRNVLGAPNKYQPGRHCVRCDLYATCPARKELAAGTVQAMTLPASVPSDDPHYKIMQNAARMLAGLTPEGKDDPSLGLALSELIFRVRLAEQAITDTKALIRSAVERVGSIPTVHGFELALRQNEVKHLIPAKALPILRQMLGEKGTLDSMKLSLPSALAAYAARQKKEKGAAKLQLTSALAEAGAIETTTQTRLEEREIQPPDFNGDTDGSIPTNAQPEPADAGAVQRPAKRGRKRKDAGSVGGDGADDSEPVGHEPDSV